MPRSTPVSFATLTVLCMMLGVTHVVPSGSLFAQVVETSSPLVENAFRMVSQGDAERARAIALLTRTSEFAAVDQVLRSIDPTKESSEALSTIADALGPALVLRLQAREDLSEKAMAVLTSTLQAQRDQRESPERLARAIEMLGKPSDDSKLGGARTLLRGGQASVSAIVQHMIANPSAARSKDLTQVLGQLGQGGADALIQYAVYGNDTARQHAMIALSKLDHPLVDAVTLSNLHAEDASDQLRSVAAGVAQSRFGRLPNRVESLAALDILLDREIDQANRDRNDPSIAPAWSLNAESGSISYVQTDLSLTQRRDAVDLGAMMRRIGNIGVDRERKIAVVDLGYRVAVDPDWGDESQADAAVVAFPWLSDPLAVLDLLDDAVELGDASATLPVLRLIQANRVDAPGVLLVHSQPAPTSLVRLVSSPTPRIRYEAATAIASITDRPSYAGSSTVHRTFAEMARLGSRPLVILVETRVRVRSQLSSLLSSMGFTVRVTGSAQEALRMVAVSGSDVRFVLTKTRLSDLAPIEFVDRIRRLEIGHDVPIVFYLGDMTANTDLSWLDSPRWAGFTTAIDLPATPSGLVPVLQEIKSRRTVQPLTAIDRTRFREIGTSQLQP